MQSVSFRATLIIFFALQIPVSPAFADEAPQNAVTPVAEAPTFVPGDTWTWSYSINKKKRTETFEKTDGETLVFRIKLDDGASLTLFRTKDTNLMYDIQTDGGKRNTREPHSGILSFPLHVGKKWEHRYVNNGVPRWADYKVVAWENVSTPAGEFEAFRVEGDDRRTDRQYGIKVTYWYAPAVKQFVKFVGIDSWNNSELPGWSFEIMSYKAGQQPSAKEPSRR